MENNKVVVTGVAIAAGFVFMSIFLGPFLFPNLKVIDLFRGVVGIETVEEDSEILTSPRDEIVGGENSQFLLGGAAITTDVIEGNGLVAELGDTVSVQYRGSTVNPETFEEIAVFDQSTPGNDLTVQLGAGQVIPGFEAALVGMREGGVRVVIIRPEAGYGDVAISTIPANSTLQFIIEMVRVSK